MAAAQAEPSVLSGGPWRDRRAAVASLAQQSEADFDFCFQTVQALVPLLEHQRWRTRALAKVALRRIGEEASANAVAAALELLGPCAHEVEAEVPAQASESEVEADDVSEDLSDRVVADVAIPAQISRPKLMQPGDAFRTWRSPSSEEELSFSRRSPDDDSSCKAHSISALEESNSDSSQLEEPHSPTCEHPPLDDLPISALGAVHVIASRGEVPGSSVPVALRIRAVRTARRLLTNSAGQPRAAVSVLGDFGGSGDLAEFRRLGVARDQVLEVRLSLVSAVVSISRRYPGSVEMAAKALADLMADEDPCVRRRATAGLAEIDMRRLHFPRRALLLPLLRALADKDPQTRRAAAEALSEKAAELTKLPILLTHGWGRDAGSFPALRTAGGDEVDALLSEVLQNSVDFWCFKSAVALSLALSGSSKSKDSKVWDVLLDRLGFASWASVVRGVGQINDDLRSAVSVRLAVPHPALVEQERTDDALKQLESSWWRLRKQAVEQLTVAVKSGSHEAAAGVIKKLTNASSGIRLAAIEILSNMSSASFQELSVKAIQSLLDRLHDPVAEVRAAASKAFSFMAFSGGLDTPGLDVVTRTVALGTNEARRAAAQVLLSISEDHGDESKAEKAQQMAMIFSGLLVRALLAGDVSGTDAKNTILSILAQAAPRGHAAVEAGLVRVAKQDVDPSVRLAALDALRAVAGEGSHRLKEAALHLVLDEDDVVQEAAAELLETLDLTDYPESKEPETAEAATMQTLPGEHPPPEEQVTMTEEQAKEIMMRYLERLGEQMRCGETTERSNAGEDEASPEEVAAIAAVEQLRQLLGPHLRDVERLRTGGRQMGVFLDGLHVTFVCPGSVAAEAGLLVGDTFCRMDDSEIMRQEELVQACLAGDSRKRVVVQRHGVEVVLWLQFPIELAASQQEEDSPAQDEEVQGESGDNQQCPVNGHDDEAASESSELLQGALMWQPISALKSGTPLTPVPENRASYAGAQTSSSESFS